MEGRHVAKRVNLNPDQAGTFYPSFRSINAHSWWLAATLTRRYPHLIILETHPGGGTYDCLTIVDGRDVANSPRIANLNRVGSIHITTRSEPHQTTNLSWAACLSGANPYLAVDHIVFHSELHKDPTPDGPLPPRVLAYQFIATALQMHQNSPDEWDARNEFIDTSGMGTGWKKDDDLRGYLNHFPGATERPLLGERSPLEATPPIGSYREPYDHFWAILRANEPVLLVSIEGMIYTQEGTFQLTKLAVEVTGGMNALAEKILHPQHQRRSICTQ